MILVVTLKENTKKKGTFAEKVEQRAVIQFCVDIGKTPTDTHKFLKQSEKHSKVSRSLIFKWHKRFADKLKTVTRMICGIFDVLRL
jgi:hypothetical protein